MPIDEVTAQHKFQELEVRIAHYVEKYFVDLQDKYTLTRVLQIEFRDLLRQVFLLQNSNEQLSQALLQTQRQLESVDQVKVRLQLERCSWEEERAAYQNAIEQDYRARLDEFQRNLTEQTRNELQNSVDDVIQEKSEELETFRRQSQARCEEELSNEVNRVTAEQKAEADRRVLQAKEESELSAEEDMEKVNKQLLRRVQESEHLRDEVHSLAQQLTEAKRECENIKEVARKQERDTRSDLEYQLLLQQRRVGMLLQTNSTSNDDSRRHHHLHERQHRHHPHHHHYHHHHGGRRIGTGEDDSKGVSRRAENRYRRRVDQIDGMGGAETSSSPRPSYY